MPNTYYITTPAYYVNALPHIGTAYTTLMADTLARFMRLDGRDVVFVSGTDEHGQKVETMANTLGQEPQAYTDEMSQHFRRLCDVLNCDQVRFVRTSEARHKKTVQAFWERLVNAGEIYEGAYKGWYSVRDEAFYNEDELVDGMAPTGTEVAWIEEPCFFFRLSKWRDRLVEFYNENRDAIQPNYRFNEVLSFLSGDVHDLCVSRSTFKWGVPVPGHKDHVVYVWVDALPYYLTALGYIEGDARFQDYWRESHHLIGKDILRFHTVYWPAMLMAIGLEPPRQVFAHGWWTNEGKKISKSAGNTIDPFEAVESYGADQIRYFMAREVAFGRDADYSIVALTRRINSDLANDYGNLCQRVLSFVEKHMGGKCLAELDDLTPEDIKIQTQSQELLMKVREAAEAKALQKMAEHIWDLIGEANRYIDAQAPWSLRKTDFKRMEVVLTMLVDVIRHVAVLSQPIVPHAAAKLLDALSIAKELRTFEHLQKSLHRHNQGALVRAPGSLFPRIDSSK